MREIVFALLLAGCGGVAPKTQAPIVNPPALAMTAPAAPAVVVDMTAVDMAHVAGAADMSRAADLGAPDMAPALNCSNGGPACTTAGTACCMTPNVCTVGTCVPCGQQGEPCCGTSTCENGTVCHADGAGSRCFVCGTSGHYCCANNYCVGTCEPPGNVNAGLCE